MSETRGLLDLPSAEGFEALERATLDGDGTVAVVGAPFAGRSAVLDWVADRLPEADRARLSPRDEPPDVPDGGALLVDDCHHLYERRVGGFDRLDAFLDRVVETDALVVAGWSRSAWAYLAEVRSVGTVFADRFTVPPLDAAGVAALVRDRWETEPRFVAAPEPVRPLVERVERTVELWNGRTLTVPYPRPNPAALDARLAADEDPESAVFERLARVSDGIPGVALAVWERSIRDGEVSPSYVDDPVGSLDLSLDAAFALRVVLSKEATTRAELSAVVGPDADRHVSTLARQGLVDAGNGRVAVRPEAVPSASTHLARRRLP